MLKKLHKREGGSLLDVGSCVLSSLIQSILKNFAELDSRCMTKLQKLAPELVNNVVQSPSNIHAASSRLVSDDEKCKAKAQERQAAIMILLHIWTRTEVKFEPDTSFKDKDDMDDSSDVLEHKEIWDLEKVFKIPSVDNILGDANFGHLVQRWL
ncbi:hypothetical protein SAY87_026817 [Trapa incisa]|uniref:Uncharacterized protein n=1 Tax=Trapa incisa TaxID=236973 RepID=A0AAN7GS37_9MYRT|nr:hypothetical protein SAY87_026817 [Trapa incisa]